MRIPKKDIAEFAGELIRRCYASRTERLQRGTAYRNMFLVGDSNGNPQQYNRTYPYIDNLSAMLYSPVELRFNIEHYGYATPIEKAMEEVATSELHKHIRQANLDTEVEQCVTWSLIKGKTFVKLLWNEDGLDPYIVQPEMMGVLREDITSLDKQEAFVHSTYYTKDRFYQMIENHPNKKDLMKKVVKHITATKSDESNGYMDAVKNIIIGGMNPYRSSDSSTPSTARNAVSWLEPQTPSMAKDVVSNLIRLDELWVWDDYRNDWTTIQIVGDDCVVSGEDSHRNLFADMFDGDNETRRLKSSDANPLHGRHPFIEFCATPLDGYFWGRSEICNIGILQEAINRRIIGINRLERLQEDPPQFFKGGTAPSEAKLTKFKKPGGFFSDSNPNAGVEVMHPKTPDNIFSSLHEMEQQFNEMAGFPPVMQGKGSSGVRSEGHADTLTRNASPRFKDRALLIERQIEMLGALALDLMKAKIGDELTCWVEEKKAGIFAALKPKNWLQQPPIDGMKPVPFMLGHLSDNCKVTVDSHSSSPAFKQDNDMTMMALFKAQAIGAEELVKHTHPPGMDTILEGLREKKIVQEKMIAEHPELLEHQAKGKKK